MLSHDNLTYNAAASSTALNCDSDDCVVRYYYLLACVTCHSLIPHSYLPLSHIAAQLVDIHGIMCIGGRVCFAQPDALKV